MNLPHYFTFIRLLISPIFLFIYLDHEYLGISQFSLPYVLLFLLMISELSDAVDGFVARKLDQVTDLGKILDPMADSVSRISMFLAFTGKPVHIPLFLIFIFICRDLMMSTLRTVCALKGYTLAASQSGKIKAIIQAFAAFLITSLLIPHSQGFITDETLQSVSFWVVTIAAFYSVYSFVEYLIVNQRYILMLSTSDK